ncbi:MAG: 6,7-dimethyl-8-ribityllumazine synthase [Bacteroidetes bacterium]|jgi:6,7-dimethyl-8-ribityllumazine synthase|nr:6,7-dimethyl-8-ribityllumazine synthase [Bacteroidota bacterium]
MPTYLEGSLVAPSDASFGIVVSRFNAFITESLLEGALDTLRRHGADMDAVTVARCPGAYEAPLVAQKMAASGAYDALIMLGAVIRGATYHFELVASGASSGTIRASMDTGVPISFGVITPDTIDQSIERAGTKAGNKGEEAALAAIEMVNVLRQV